MYRQSDRDLPRTNYPKGFSMGANLTGHKCQDVFLSSCLPCTRQCFVIFSGRKIPKAKKLKAEVEDGDPPAPPEPEVKYLCQDRHVVYWILMVSSLLQWLQWMKQGTIPRSKVRQSHSDNVQWLMQSMANISPHETGMDNNTIKMHLVLHICDNILDNGVPENVNSAYTESAHITLAKRTSANTQKRAVLPYARSKSMLLFYFAAKVGR